GLGRGVWGWWSQRRPFPPRAKRRSPSLTSCPSSSPDSRVRRLLGRRCRIPPAQGQPEMKFFVDTADTAEIRDLAATGLVDGVTTNPSLIHKAGRNFLEVVEEICGIVDGPGAAEVVALDHEGMMREA